MELNLHTREDLLQEALAYLWSKAQKYPAQPLAWYLRGVKFYLKDIRSSGRSLDSPKRRAAQVEFTKLDYEWPGGASGLELDGGIFSEICADDIFCLLADRLGPIDRIILDATVEGMGISEIAGKLRVPRGFVVRHRLKIAGVAIELGVTPISTRSARRILPNSSKRLDT